MEFKSNESIITGLYFDNNHYNLLVLNPTTEWKKVYINLTEIINNSGVPSELKFFFGVDEASVPFLTSNPQIYIDNIKLVHF